MPKDTQATTATLSVLLPAHKIYKAMSFSQLQSQVHVEILNNKFLITTGYFMFT